MTDKEKQKLNHLNALSCKARTAYYEKVEATLHKKYKSSLVGEEGRNQLIQLFWALYHWIEQPRETEEFEQSQVVYQYKQAMEYGMTLDGEHRENYFSELKAFTNSIGKRTMPKVSVRAIKLGENYANLCSLPFEDLPKNLDELGPLRLPYPYWVKDDEMQKSWQKTKEFFKWDKFILKQKPGRQ